MMLLLLPAGQSMDTDQDALQEIIKIQYADRPLLPGIHDCLLQRTGARITKAANRKCVRKDVRMKKGMAW